MILWISVKVSCLCILNEVSQGPDYLNTNTNLDQKHYEETKLPFPNFGKEGGQFCRTFCHIERICVADSEQSEEKSVVFYSW